MARRSVRGELLRRAVAEEAARIMAEQGIDDYRTAKRKAAERFGVTDHAVLPGNVEIERALAGYHRLFAADTHAGALADLRRSALAAMRLLDDFEPRLVGPVLSGTATEHSEISLHVFADTVETVAIALLDAAVRYRLAQRRLKVLRDGWQAFPALQFELDGRAIEAVVLPRNGLRQPPFSPVDGRPMRRAARGEVEALIDEGPEPAPFAFEDDAGPDPF